MLSRRIKQSGEEFIVEVSVDDKNAAVTDERGTRVTITYNSGHFNVRLPNGWGNWAPSMERAVKLAVELCFEARDQLTGAQAYQEMLDYVKGPEG